ncbi:MAG: hypothetical protein R8G66_08610 [Cytophagales bacterium]|nr:hypothetical protein [Cytophagales bacterium]
MKIQDLEIIQKVLGLSPEDQSEVLNYIEHISKVRELNAHAQHQEQGLREIQQAFTSQLTF